MADAPAAANPPAHKSIDTLLKEARSGLRRLDARQAHAAAAAGALLLDIRPDAQRRAAGTVPGALVVERNVLEWRCDAACPSRDPRIAPSRALIVMCNEGYQSSLAAAALCALGREATDIIGGFQAWRATGLPVEPFTEKNLMRAIECPCGHQLECADDDELFRLARDHVDREHPKMNRSDEQLGERITADEYDVAVTAARVSGR